MQSIFYLDPQFNYKDKIAKLWPLSLPKMVASLLEVHKATILRFFVKFKDIFVSIKIFNVVILSSEIVFDAELVELCQLFICSSVFKLPIYSCLRHPEHFL